MHLVKIFIYCQDTQHKLKIDTYYAILFFLNNFFPTEWLNSRPCLRYQQLHANHRETGASGSRHFHQGQGTLHLQNFTIIFITL